jgi:hypothetical protein
VLRWGLFGVLLPAAAAGRAALPPRGVAAVFVRRSFTATVVDAAVLVIVTVFLPYGPPSPCRCRQLLSEQEVQARAADAARANVESHYNYIASIYTAFVDK